MFLSKLSNGTSYLFFFDELGIRRRVTTKCKLKSEATKFLQNLKVSERERRLNRRRRLLSQFKEDFVAYSRTLHTVKTQECSDTAFRQFQEKVGDVPLHLVGVREIERFLSEKTSEASVWSARKYYISLASAFETARRWHLISQNPFRQVQKPKAPEIHPAYFKLHEFQKLLAFTPNEDFKILCVCAVSTGLRLGELSALRWKDVDLSRKGIIVQNSHEFITKSKENRVVPLNERPSKELAMRKEGSQFELVFHRDGLKLEKDYVSKTFKKCVGDAELNAKLHFHSLRHTFASWLVQDGVSLYEVQKLLGHSSISVTQVYSHLQPEGLHSTVNRITIPMN